MYSLLRAGALAAVLTGTASAALADLPAAAQPAAAQPASQLTIAISNVTPQVATPGATITVTGTVTNSTTEPVSALSIGLLSSSQDFSSRSVMDAYMRADGSTPVVAEGAPVAIAAALRPGGTTTWRARFKTATAGMGSTFGVYPLQAQVTDLQTGLAATAKTLLPFWPGGKAQVSPLRTAWLWPLIDSPHRQVCPALTDNSLAASFGSGGRLGSLLSAGTQYPQADLTWVIDPALLGDAATMRQPYQTGGNPADCGGATSHPASAAASNWLITLRSDTAGQPMVLTPYANVDIAALDRRGLSADVGTAYTLGKSLAEGVLNRSFGMNMALPAGGKADLSTLTALATGEHATSVVLNSSEMPRTDPAKFADDAVAQIRTGAGTTMNVLLADDTITSVLSAGTGAATPAAQFAVAQRYLAETAMIAAELPEAQRSLVVDPPETWAPSQALAGALLHETVTAPWLKPVTLGAMAVSTDSGSRASRRDPPSTQVSPRELSKTYLHTVSGLGAQLRVFRAMLYQAPAGYTSALSQALAAAESSAWRGGGRSAAQGAVLAEGLTEYLTGADKKVKIVPSLSFRMGGSSGSLPISIQNNLDEDIKVQLGAQPVARTSPLRVSGKESMVIVPAHKNRTVKLLLSSAPEGTTQIALHLTGADGTPLAFSNSVISVQSTRYGRAILFLIAAAIGVLVATSMFRAGRHWLHDGAHSARGAHGDRGTPAPNQTAPSNVVISERTPTEAPDDLADARRWADGT